jgi:tight adherence protein B
MFYLIIALVFLSLVFVAIAVGILIFRRDLNREENRRRRVKVMSPKVDATGAALQGLLRDNSLSTIPLLDRILNRLPRLGDLRLLLQQAGNPCNLGTLVLMTCTFAAMGGLVGLLQGSGFLATGLVVLGAMGPIIWLKALRKRRLAAFDEQFPEAVELVGRALRAGHSFGSALKMVAEEMDDPVAEEFGKTFADYSYGKGMEDALKALVERVGLQDLKFFATAVTLQRETGGNLTEILDNISYIIRERFRLLRQVRALSAEGRLSGTILSITAPALLGLLWIISPRYIDMMFTHPMGHMMLIAGGVFQILGIVVIKRLVKMDV